MTDFEIKAKELGARAQRSGKQSIPVLDADLMDLVSEANPTGVVGHPMTIKIFVAWSQGWHAANRANS
jgi:hypothetical protein